MKSGFVIPLTTLLVTAAFTFYVASFPEPVSGSDACTVRSRPLGLDFPGTNVGAVPDGGAACAPSPGTARDITFNVAGMSGFTQVTGLSMTFGSPNHTWMGDIVARLIAPNGTSHTIFGRTGATTAGGAGDNSDLGATYNFADFGITPPNGGWWEASTVAGAGTVMPSGSYRTTESGGAGATNPQPPTNMGLAFSGVSNPNGTWILRVTDGCSSDTGAITAATLSLQGGDPFGNPRADFDADGRTDLSVYRASEGNWYLNRSSQGFLAVGWGQPTDIPTPGDFDGDGRTDIAIFRPSNGQWWILPSGGASVITTQFGMNGDIPVFDDYNGDGKSDIAVYRPSTSTWFVLASGTGTTTIVPFGTSGDVPVRGDYEGDAKTDIAIYRPSNGQWWILRSSGGVSTTTFGLPTDKPVPGDYDGDGKDDITIYRPSNGQWWILSSLSGGIWASAFGLSSDVPVPADYDGDGKVDLAVYRNGTWWINRSTAGITAISFGLSTDSPIPSMYVPQ